MKKLLVLALTVAMVMTLAISAMAAITVTGDVTTSIDFNQLSSSGANDKSSQFDNDLIFKGAVSDKVSETVKVKYTYNKGDATGAVTKAPYTSYATLWIDEAYTTVKADYGTFNLGMWEIKPYNMSMLDANDSTYGKIKIPFSVQFISKDIITGGHAELYYFRGNNTDMDYDAGKTPTYSGAYIANFTYKQDLFGFDYNYINEQNPNNGRKAGYVVNAYVLPMDGLKVYCEVGTNNGYNFGGDGSSSTTGGITNTKVTAYGLKRAEVGALLTEGNWYFQAEYNNEKIWDSTIVTTIDATHTTTGAIGSYNPYAWKIGYNFTNKTTLEWRHKDTSQRDMGTQELRYILKF